MSCDLKNIKLIKPEVSCKVSSISLLEAYNYSDLSSSDESDTKVVKKRSLVENYDTDSSLSDVSNPLECIESFDKKQHTFSDTANTSRFQEEFDKKQHFTLLDISNLPKVEETIQSNQQEIFNNKDEDIQIIYQNKENTRTSLNLIDCTADAEKSIFDSSDVPVIQKIKNSCGNSTNHCGYNRYYTQYYNYEEFVSNSFNIESSLGVKLDRIPNKEMNFYQEIKLENDFNAEDNEFNHRSMLENTKGQSPANSTRNSYDSELDEDINEILDELAKDLSDDDENDVTSNHSNSNRIHEDVEKKKSPCKEVYSEIKGEKAKDFPKLYKEKLKDKIIEAKYRLESLSKSVCCFSNSSRTYILRMEQDHKTPFCKLDPPQHPPLTSAWTNFWKFTSTTQCVYGLFPPDGHAHTTACAELLFQHVGTGITTKSKDINECEFPKHIMHVVALFQDFARVTIKDHQSFMTEEMYDTIYDNPEWVHIKLRTNFKNEIMLIAFGKGVNALIQPLKTYFEVGPGKVSNVVSVYYINQKWSQKKGPFLPTLLYGIPELKDTIGPLSLSYTPETFNTFNSIQLELVGRLFYDYLESTPDTIMLEVGCNEGVLSLMLSTKFQSVIGITTLETEAKIAKENKSFNKIKNASFLQCHTKDILSVCAPLVKNKKTVVIFNLNSPYGKFVSVMKAIKRMSTVWRIIVYGTNSKDYGKNCSQLSLSENYLGDEFLPVQACILDKSPTNTADFYLAILLERKISAEPLKVGVEANYTITTFKKNYKKKPRDPLKMFDSPLLPMDDDTTVKLPPVPEPEKSPVYNPCSNFKQPKEKTQPDFPKIKDLLKIYDFHSPVEVAFKNSSQNEDSDAKVGSVTVEPNIKKSCEHFSSKITTNIDLTNCPVKPMSTAPIKTYRMGRSKFDSPLLPDNEEISPQVKKSIDRPEPSRSLEPDAMNLPLRPPQARSAEPFFTGFTKGSVKHPPVVNLTNEDRWDTPSPPSPPRVNSLKTPPMSPKNYTTDKRWDDSPEIPMYSPKSRWDTPSPPRQKRLSKSYNNSTCNGKSWYSNVPFSLQTSPTFHKQSVAPSYVNTLQSKSEKQSFPTATTKVYKPRRSEEREEGELSDSPCSDRVTSNNTVVPMDLDSDNNEVEIIPVEKKEKVIECQTIKSDDEDDPTLDDEQEKKPLANNLDYFENMPTPKHNAAAAQLSVLPEIKRPNFTHVDGFEISINSNKSFLAEKVVVKAEKPPSPILVKQESPEKIVVKKEKSPLSTTVKKETKNPSDDEPDVIVEKTVSQVADDLRNLLHKKKILEKELKKEVIDSSTSSEVKEKPPGRSSSKDRLSPVLAALKRRRRSPLPRSRRSPLSPTLSKSRRSPLSPIRSYSWRSPSPRYSRRSPSPRPFRRSPSPTYSRRSLLSKKYRRSPSPRYLKRSPRTPSPRYSRRSRSRSRSPQHGRYSRYSDYYTQYKKTTSVESDYEYKHKFNKKASSALRRYSSSRSPSPSYSRRRKSRSITPKRKNGSRKRSKLSKSPSPNFKKIYIKTERNTSPSAKIKKEDEPKHKKKPKNEKIKENGNETSQDIWDIPGLSSLSDSSAIDKLDNSPSPLISVKSKIVDTGEAK